MEAIVQQVWDRLCRVRALRFEARSKASGAVSGWNGCGEGVVEAVQKGDQLLFWERGKWVSEVGIEYQFSNVFRWTFKAKDGVLILEHLRYGNDKPVFLFALAPVAPGILEPIESHVCKDDCYFGQLRDDEEGIRFCWRVVGPRKNEEIDYLYT